MNVGASRSGEAWLIRSPVWCDDGDVRWDYLGSGSPDTNGLFDREAHAKAVEFLDAIDHDREPVCAIDDGR